VAGIVVLGAAGLLAAYLAWPWGGSGPADANLRSIPVGDTTATFVTWDGRVTLVVWKDFALT
jgi:hypothetical protein